MLGTRVLWSRPHTLPNKFFDLPARLAGRHLSPCLPRFSILLMETSSHIEAPNYAHVEMAESLGNPYGPNGRAALNLMKLSS